ncbi:hypothetical protein LNP74_08465 [Klebsiella pneumoniae subsp. pneumoniae]|nr:hypothetical protein [Klebsiella pneumoniae subsp. pneumoniae]
MNRRRVTSVTFCQNEDSDDIEVACDCCGAMAPGGEMSIWHMDDGDVGIAVTTAQDSIMQIKTINMPLIEGKNHRIPRKFILKFV